jgi:hypothetical protein
MPQGSLRVRVFAPALLFLAACVSDAPPAAQVTDPYETLRAAYVARDPALAASAYTPSAQLIYEYEAREVYTGTEAIQSSFAAFFDQIAPEDTLDLNFRIAARAESDGEIEERGIYRLQIGSALTSYGGFETRRDVLTGRFVSDTGTAATREDFEALPGDLMFPDDPAKSDRKP